MKILKKLSPVTLLISLSAYGIAFVIWGLFLSMENQELKQCTKCHEYKNVCNFSNSSWGGIVSQCKKCLSLMAWIRKNPNYAPVQSLPDEIWKDVDDFERMYQVSNFGRSKGLDRVIRNFSGGLSQKREKLLVPTKNKYGYMQVGLLKNGKRKRLLVHILVAKAFIPNPENKPEVNHEDGVKHNNHVSNLTWATTLENYEHSVRTGLRDPLKINHKLTESQVRDIIYMIAHKQKKCREIANAYNVKISCIYHIKDNRTWKHIPRPA